MAPMSADRVEVLRKNLRIKARGGDAELRIATSDVLLLLDELGRAMQGAERLRRQNRRLRLRCKKLGIELEDDGEVES